MRINVYSQELTSEVERVKKEVGANIFEGARIYLRSPTELHHTPDDDDRSAITFWLPMSPTRRSEMAKAFIKLAMMFDKDCLG